MQDILKKYKKNKIKANIIVILTSFVLAIWINIFLIDWTNIGQNLKTSVLNSKVQTNKADFYLEEINNNLFVVSNKKISNIDSLSLSITYNPENVTIQNIKSDIWNLINISNTKWVNSIIITFDKWTNIDKNNKILKIDLSKKYNRTENINIINANFKDLNWWHYSLSTSWVTF
jgi:hypothetical protein